MKGKEPTTIEQQITRLRIRGFVIESTEEKEVKKFLSNVGYYRISGYFIPYYNRHKEQLDKKTAFKKFMNVYWFDKEFKSILLYLITSIEVEYKARIANKLCLEYGGSFYYNSDFFSKQELHDKWIRKFQENMNFSDKNDDLFKKWHKDKYGAEFPLWVAFQLVNINDLSKFYDNLKTKYKKELQDSLGGWDYLYTQSWLRSTTVVRNISAHNGRLFYRSISTSPKLTNELRSKGLNLKRVFVIISVMKNLCLDDTIWYKFFSDLISLVMKYPDIDLIHYGFPNNWYDILR